MRFGLPSFAASCWPLRPACPVILWSRPVFCPCACLALWAFAPRRPCPAPPRSSPLFLSPLSDVVACTLDAFPPFCRQVCGPDTFGPFSGSSPVPFPPCLWPPLSLLPFTLLLGPPRVVRLSSTLPRFCPSVSLGGYHPLSSPALTGFAFPHVCFRPGAPGAFGLPCGPFSCSVSPPVLSVVSSLCRLRLATHPASGPSCSARLGSFLPPWPLAPAVSSSLRAPLPRACLVPPPPLPPLPPWH